MSFYGVGMENITVSALQDLWTIAAPSDAVVILHEVRIGQNTDFGDALAAGLGVNIVRYASAGSGGTGVTPTELELGGNVAGGTYTRNNTSQGATPAIILADSFNVQAGWLYLPAPEHRIVISPSGVLAIEIPENPGSPIDVYASMIIEEIGG